MKKAPEKISKAVGNIQNSSTKARMAWAIGLTALSAVLVLSIWFKTMDDVTNISGSNAFTIEEERNEEAGIVARLRLRTARTIVYFQKKLSQKNEITIEL